MSLLSTKDAAEYIGSTESTLRYWRYMDQGPKSFRLGKQVKYRREDIDTWIEAQMASTSRGGVVA